ncbi:MAG: 30S ribosomal protein S12 methylthiotransferase RimO [Actinobacteria bacterium]|nr:30S ribosomal protein S12 methylthiotransferase RimO [Actinomycetota bacterium]
MVDSEEVQIRVAFVTLGCPKNEVDTNRMRTLVSNSNYRVVDSVEDADLIVVNTCSFITEATEESLDVIFELLSDDDIRARGGRIIVAGCMPARFGKDLQDELSEVAGFLPVDEEDRILELIERLTGAPAVSTAPGVMRAAESCSAYVKISDGCDRFCSYCTIPFIRGRYHSRTLEEIADEVASLVSQGVKEIILIGQDTGVWGHDLEGEADLVGLVGHLCGRFDDTWFRIMYLQPEGISDELLDLFAHSPNLCKYLDIPLQHSNARILHEMNRTGSSEEFLSVLSNIRSKIPSIVVRTTIIAGFPGETEADFAELREFLENAEFDYVGVFAYSQEDGTRAGERTDQVPESIRIARANNLRELCDTISFAHNTGRIGQIVEVLIEDFEETDDTIEAIGRTQFQAPEIDGAVHLPKVAGEPGDIVCCRLVDSFCYEYEGELLQ